MKQQGFTLINLLSTLSITATIMGIGLPSFGHLIESSRANTANAALYNSIQFARTTAVSQGKDVTVCGSNDGVRCEKDWSKSVLVFMDVNLDKEAQPEEIVLVRDLDLKSATIRTKLSFGLASTKFNFDGSSSYTGSMVYCPNKLEPKFIRKITWNRAGRPYIGRDTNQDGVVDHANGDSLYEVCVM